MSGNKLIGEVKKRFGEYYKKALVTLISSYCLMFIMTSLIITNHIIFSFIVFMILITILFIANINWKIRSNIKGTIFQKYIEYPIVIINSLIIFYCAFLLMVQNLK